MRLYLVFLPFLTNENEAVRTERSHCLKKGRNTKYSLIFCVRSRISKEMRPNCRSLQYRTANKKKPLLDFTPVP